MEDEDEGGGGIRLKFSCGGVPRAPGLGQDCKGQPGGKTRHMHVNW